MTRPKFAILAEPLTVRIHRQDLAASPGPCGVMRSDDQIWGRTIRRGGKGMAHEEGIAFGACVIDRTWRRLSPMGCDPGMARTVRSRSRSR